MGNRVVTEDGSCEFDWSDIAARAQAQGPTSFPHAELRGGVEANPNGSAPKELCTCHERRAQRKLKLGVNVRGAAWRERGFETAAITERAFAVCQAGAGDAKARGRPCRIEDAERRAHAAERAGSRARCELAKL